jgi:hypothetical protein
MMFLKSSICTASQNCHHFPIIPRSFLQICNIVPRAIEWIVQRVNETGDDSGVLYFADDDNSYDLRLFEEVT